MQEYINVDVLTNWVFMLRADVDGAICLADDDRDARFYEKIVHEKARVVPAQGVALPLLESVQQRGIEGVVAIVRGVAAPEDDANIFRPATGDVASVLLLSRSSRKVISEICGTTWLDACERQRGPLIDRVLRIAHSIGRIRRARADGQLDTPPEESCHTFVDWNVLDTAWSHLDHLLGEGVASQIKIDCELRQSTESRGARRECDGMDAIHIVATATQFYRPRGLAPYRQVTPEELLGMLRVAFDPADLEQDDVFWKMKKWERANRAYPLLLRWRSFDPLDVVWDQRYWEQDLSSLLRMLDPGALIGVYKMDLDNFKRVNDQLGHAEGDNALRLYCKTVQGVLGAVGEVYRRGGDEIVVLAPGISEGVAREMAEVTRSKVEAVFQRWSLERGLPIGPTASIGLVLGDGRGTAAEIVRLADAAQHDAKQQGKNRVVISACEH